MITYPTIFFGVGQGPLREDFDDYPVGEVSGYGQIWQHYTHHWLVPRNPNKYAGITWKDYGVSGAFADFDEWAYGSVNINDINNYKGVGNFENNPWSGFSAGFYRDSRGQFTSADQLRGYSFINFDWGNQPPINAYKSDFWSAKFIGKLNLPINGTYQFYVERDDACRIYVGREDGPNTLVFNQWGTTPPAPGTLEPATPFTFTAGDIDILIQFYEDTSNARLKLYWSKPTTPGGGPTTPPTIILPSDFGNSGYIRVFTTQGPFDDQGRESINFDGSYRLGVIKADPVRDDYANHVLDMSGSYRLGISYSDKEAEPAFDRINHAGYYVRRYQEASGLDQARNEIANRGFYAYHTAFAQEAEPSKTELRVGDGYYAYKNVHQYQREYTRVDYKMGGFYDVGRVTAESGIDLVSTTIDPQGFYIGLYSSFRGKNQAYNEQNFAGAYSPLYIYANYTDEAQNNVYPSGYYITGYINSDQNRDYGRTNINHAGHHVFYLVTTDALRESHTGVNQIGIEYGIYFYKNFLEREAEPAKNTLFQDGYYASRYIHLPTTDPVNNIVDPQGLYYPVYVYETEKEPSFNRLKPEGYYVTGFDNFYVRDFGANNVNYAGHYVSGYEQRFWDDQGQNNLAPVGNYFFGIHTFKEKDQSYHFLGLLGEYQGIYVYAPYDEHAYDKVDLAGLYYWKYKAHPQSDQGYDRITFNGDYFIRFFPAYGERDYGKTNLNTSGYYITGYLYSYGTDVVKDRIEMAGNYFYRFLYGTGNDSAYQTQDFNGDYFYRFLFEREAEPAFDKLTLLGDYYGRYLTNNYTDPAFNKLNPNGIYYPKYLGNKEADPCLNFLGFTDGLYYNTRPAWKWDDQGCNLIGMSGVAYYRYVPTRDADPCLNYLGMDDGRYFYRYIMTKDTDPSFNILAFAGEYLREAWLASDSSLLEINFASEFVTFAEVQEGASLTASVSGAFVAAKQSSTLDYWLEIYQRPTYNMGKSQQYFSI